MDVHDYVSVMRKRWLSILLITLACVAGALGYSLAATPMYTATTQLYVSVQGSASTSDLLQGANYSRQQVTSYTQMVTSPLVLGPVIVDLGLDERAEGLAGRVATSSPLNSSLINIEVSDPNAAIAAATADEIAQQFITVVDELERPADGGDSSVKVSVVRPAAAPEAPSSPNTKLNLALGLLVGLVLGAGFAVLRESLDTRVRSEEDVARVTTVPVIASIGFDDQASAAAFVADPRSPYSESIRRLRTNLQFLDVENRPRSIVITSALPGEGKSTTAVNLAQSLSEAGGSVLLVDADLRRPSIAHSLGLESDAGLTTILIGRATLPEVVQAWGDARLHVLTSGQVPPNPSELLGSHAMAVLLSQMATRYDVVVLDSPPLLPVTDAALLAKLAGGALVVANSTKKLQRAQLGEALAALEAVGARVLGIVLNAQPRKKGQEYYSYRTEPAPARHLTAERGL